jgi:hypothetical protein
MRLRRHAMHIKPALNAACQMMPACGKFLGGTRKTSPIEQGKAFYYGPDCVPRQFRMQQVLYATAASGTTRQIHAEARSQAMHDEGVMARLSWVLQKSVPQWAPPHGTATCLPPGAAIPVLS